MHVSYDSLESSLPSYVLSWEHERKLTHSYSLKTLPEEEMLHLTLCQRDTRALLLVSIKAERHCLKVTRFLYQPCAASKTVSSESLHEILQQGLDLVFFMAQDQGEEEAALILSAAEWNRLKCFPFLGEYSATVLPTERVFISLATSLEDHKNFLTRSGSSFLGGIPYSRPLSFFYKSPSSSSHRPGSKP